MDDVKEFGDAIDDDAIFQLDQELSDTMIISAIPDDDFETDEENAALSGRGRGSTSSAKKKVSPLVFTVPFFEILSDDADVSTLVSRQFSC